MSSQKGDPIAYDVSDAIAVVTLARPPVNALDLAAVHALIAALNRAAADENVRAVVLASGVPKRFCAGLDIGGLIGKSTDEIRTLVHELYVGLYDAQAQLGKPSIAAVNGAARGGGMTVAVSCDVVLASESASFGYPEIDLGVLPAIHFVHLPRISAATAPSSCSLPGAPSTQRKRRGSASSIGSWRTPRSKTRRSNSPLNSRRSLRSRFAAAAPPCCARSASTIGAALPAPLKISPPSPLARMRRSACALSPKSDRPNRLARGPSASVPARSLLGAGAFGPLSAGGQGLRQCGLIR